MIGIGSSYHCNMVVLHCQTYHGIKSLPTPSGDVYFKPGMQFMASGGRYIKVTTNESGSDPYIPANGHSQHRQIAARSLFSSQGFFRGMGFTTMPAGFFEQLVNALHQFRNKIDSLSRGGLNDFLGKDL